MSAEARSAGRSLLGAGLRWRHGPHRSRSPSRAGRPTRSTPTSPRSTPRSRSSASGAARRVSPGRRSAVGRDRRPDGPRARPGGRPSPSGSIVTDVAPPTLIFGDRLTDGWPPQEPAGGRRTAACASTGRGRATSGTGAPGVVVARPAASEPAGGLDRALARLRRTAFGRPLANAEEAAERLTKVKALAVFSSDNLSSVAYATEAILFTLLAAGSDDVRARRCRSRRSSWPCSPIIVVSYRQTIRAYPNGGGSYIVARENLGVGAGLVAAAALLTDYVLTVSVSVAAGIAAITSAFPGAARRPAGRARGARDRGRDAHQPARRPRERHDLRHPDVRVRRLDARAHRRSGIVRTLARRPAAGHRRHAARRAGRDARAPCC